MMERDIGILAPGASLALSQAEADCLEAALELGAAARWSGSVAVGAALRARRLRAAIQNGHRGRRRIELAIAGLDEALALLEAERSGWEAAAEYERRPGEGRRETRAA